MAGKHSEDYIKNLEALQHIRRGDKLSAARVLKTTSKKNQADFIKRVTRGTRNG